MEVLEIRHRRAEHLCAALGIRADKRNRVALARPRCQSRSCSGGPDNVRIPGCNRPAARAVLADNQAHHLAGRVIGHVDCVPDLVELHILLVAQIPIDRDGGGRRSRNLFPPI